MMSFRSHLVSVSSVLVLAAGCGTPGVTNVAPGPPIGGAKSPTTPASTAGTMAAMADPNKVTPPAGAAGTPTTPPPTPTGGTVAAPVAGTAAPLAGATAPAAGAASPVAGAASPLAGAVAPQGGAAAPVGGMVAATGGTGAAAGSAAPATAACPSGWKCVDPVKDAPVDGLELTDPMGAKIPFSCSDGSMSIVDCMDSNPKASCPSLPDPFCARINVPGLFMGTSCAQRCTP
jgi:hypothetical protein